MNLCGAEQNEGCESARFNKQQQREHASCWMVTRWGQKCGCVGHKLCHECLFEGITALKRIQMGDRDDDGAVTVRSSSGLLCVPGHVLMCNAYMFVYADRECASHRG